MMYYEYCPDVWRPQPHSLWTNDKDFDDMMEWCLDQFGPMTAAHEIVVTYPVVSSWSCCSRFQIFRFSKEVDATAFKVRWG